jgi:hypothetical protein
VSTATARLDALPTNRRARRYAGTAASDMTSELIAFAAAYACGTFSKKAHAGETMTG